MVDLGRTRRAALGGLGLAIGVDVGLFAAGPIRLRRRTGGSGWLRSAGATPAERLANLLFVGACGLDLGGPVCVITGLLHPPSRWNRRSLHLAGGCAGSAGMAFALAAQSGMGVAWQTGIDPRAETPLVTGGLFGVVRNPVYAGMFAASLGVSLLAPTALVVPALVMRALSCEVQTRWVEEPFLRRRHGAAYLAYAAVTGRFLPLVGRLEDTRPPT